MTKLTLALKKDGGYNRIRLRLKKPNCFPASHHTYTNFSGNYGQSLTKKELSEDLKYAEAVRRQKFW